MKRPWPAFAFFGGFSLALALCAGAYFLSPYRLAYVEPSEPVVWIKGTIELRPKLAAIRDETSRLVRSGGGELFLSINEFDGPLKLAVMKPPVLNPQFPFHFSLPVKREALARAKGRLFLSAKYCLNSSASCPTAAPHFHFTKTLHLDSLDEDATEVSVGVMPQVRFYDRYLVPEQCPQSGPLLAGKISTTSQFREKFAGTKIAFLVIPSESKVHRDVRPEDVRRITQHLQFIDSSRAKTPFQVPAARAKSAFFTLAAVPCGPKDSLEACAARYFLPDANANPYGWFPSSTKDYLAPHCGKQDVVLYLFPGEFSRGPVGSPVYDPNLPEEIARGEPLGRKGKASGK